MKKVKITNLGPNKMCRNTRGAIDPAFPTTIRDNEGTRHVLTGNPIFFEGPTVVLEDFDDLYTMDTPDQPPPDVSRQRMFAEENSYYPVDCAQPSFEQMAYERSATHEASIQHANRQASRHNDRNALGSVVAIVVMFVIVLMTIIFAILALSLTFDKSDDPQPEPASEAAAHASHDTSTVSVSFPPSPPGGGQAPGKPNDSA